MFALESTEVTKRYAGGHADKPAALDHVSLKIAQGRLFGFLGRNGAGKTTFIKIATTLLEPTSGEVRVLGFDVMKEARSVRERIALVPQEGRVFFHLSPWEHIYEYLRVRGFSAESGRTRADELVEAMGLTAYRNEPGLRLSGGIQQRTLVAMILATEAPFLFLDEPTLGMDPFARRQVWEVIRRAVRHGSTVLLTTHYLDEAEQLTDELAVIEGGTIRFQGSPEVLKSTVGREVRLQFSGGFQSSELERYGQVLVDRGRITLLTTRSAVAELTELALRRGQTVGVGPVTLEEAFLELVGRGIEEEES